MSRMRPLQGLVVGLSLSVLNLIGAFVFLASLGGTGEWGRAQFLGLFGLLEIATGIISVFGPNMWRLPVAQAQTSPRTEVKVAISTLAIPHWAASAKCVAGLIMVGIASLLEGMSPNSLYLVPVILSLAIAVGCVTLIAVRFGVARPDFDVWALTIHRAGHPDRPLPAFSVTALAILVLINVGIFPAVRLLPPSVLFRPEFAPSVDLLLSTVGVAALLTLICIPVWWGRFAFRAPPEQQTEAQEAAEGTVRLLPTDANAPSGG